MLLLILISLVSSASAVDFSNTELGQALQLRDRRQTSFSVYYLCGTYPNQYISYTRMFTRVPAMQNSACPCTNCNTCQYRCSTTQICQQYNNRWTCQNGCCRVSKSLGTANFLLQTSNNPPATTTIRPAPVCGGREVSGGYCRSGSRCDAGFLCTSNNICCRCAYGTSTGPCINLQCPDNYQCNANNECCPYQVGK